MLKIALCDEEVRFRKMLADEIRVYMCNRSREFSVCEYNPNHLLEALEGELRDCKMFFVTSGGAHSDGFRLASRIRRHRPEAAIVLMAEDESCAWDGYRIGALRCIRRTELLKTEYLKDCLNTICAKPYAETTVTLPFVGGKHTFSPYKLLYVESRLHKLFFYIYEDGIREYAMYGKLNYICDKISCPFLVRTHQSFLVNLKFAETLERGHIVLRNGIVIDVSRAHMAEVKVAYEKYRTLCDKNAEYV